MWEELLDCKLTQCKYVGQFGNIHQIFSVRTLWLSISIFSYLHVECLYRDLIEIFFLEKEKVKQPKCLPIIGN